MNKASENKTWSKAAIRSGSPRTYEVVDISPIGVGRYVPTKPAPPKGTNK